MTMATNIKAEILPGAFLLSRKEMLPKCEAQVAEGLVYRGRNSKHKQRCACEAKIELDGKKFCVRHAQQHALTLLLAKS
jgi:hypothetical protein